MAWMLLTGGALLIWWALTGTFAAQSPPPARPATAESAAPGQPGALTELALAVPGALLLGALVWPFQNGVALAVAGAVGAVLPRLWRQRRRRLQRLRINAAMGQALLHLSTVAHTYRVPYQALSAAVEAFPVVIREEYRRALQAQEANIPLPEALRQAARRLGDNFYAHQLAELADVSIRTGADFVGALIRLVQRHSLLEEVQAEERTATSGYVAFARAFAVLSLSPLLWWVLTGSASLSYFVEGGFARVLLGWAVATAALCSYLPDLLSVDEV